MSTIIDDARVSVEPAAVHAWSEDEPFTSNSTIVASPVSPRIAFVVLASASDEQLGEVKD